MSLLDAGPAPGAPARSAASRGAASRERPAHDSVLPAVLDWVLTGMAWGLGPKEENGALEPPLSPSPATF